MDIVIVIIGVRVTPVEVMYFLQTSVDFMRKDICVQLFVDLISLLFCVCVAQKFIFLTLNVVTDVQEFLKFFSIFLVHDVIVFVHAFDREISTNEYRNFLISFSSRERKLPLTSLV